MGRKTEFGGRIISYTDRHRDRRAGRHFTYDVEDGLGLDALNADAFHHSMEFHALPGQDIHLSVSGYRRHGFWLFRLRTRTGFTTLIREDMDAISIHIPSTGHLHRLGGGRYALCEAGSAILTEVRAYAGIRATAGLDLVGCLVSRHRIVRCLTSMGEDSGSTPDFVPRVPLETMALRAFAAAVPFALDVLFESRDELDLIRLPVEDMLIYTLLAGWPQVYGAATASGATASHALQTALAFIDVHLAEPFTIGDVAKAAGVSVRSLQKMFQHDVGSSPSRYIIDQRLHRVHEALRQEEGMRFVSEIASRWGFSHMSDFSRRYKKKYGILPSGQRRK